MSNKLSNRDLDEMFAAYCEQPNAHYISEKCHVNRRTAAKYIVTADFAGRYKKVQERTDDRTVDAIAKDRARNLNLVNAALASFVKHLSGKASAPCPKCGEIVFVPVPTMNATHRDLCELIKTHCLLVGDPTDRPAGNSEEPKLIHYCLPIPPALQNPAASAPGSIPASVIAPQQQSEATSQNEDTPDSPEQSEQP